MISSPFKKHIAQELGIPILNIKAVSGGDISKAYCIDTSAQRFFLKVNESANALKMFHTEKEGLQMITKTKAIKAPEVLCCGQFDASSFILMDFIASKNPTSKNFETLGRQLAVMHAIDVGGSYGWNQDNYIGSLPQSNKNHADWTLFYVRERLWPQIRWAHEKNLLNAEEIPSETKLLKGCERLFPKVRPALLHGDLWGGNYLIDTHEVPFLIDPAVYFGHHEVDLAMTQLFGGFSSEFYAAYAEQIPLEPLYNERRDVYQLYYLLVHLNLFGSSYYAPVKQLLKTYF